VTSADSRSSAERETPPDSRHVGLIGGLGVGAAVIYYRAIAAGCADRGTVPRMTIVHAHAPTTLAQVAAGRIDELARGSPTRFAHASASGPCAAATLSGSRGTDWELRDSAYQACCAGYEHREGVTHPREVRLRRGEPGSLVGVPRKGSPT
jgi:hypothetical protein